MDMGSPVHRLSCTGQHRGCAQTCEVWGIADLAQVSKEQMKMWQLKTKNKALLRNTHAVEHYQLKHVSQCKSNELHLISCRWSYKYTFLFSVNAIHRFFIVPHPKMVDNFVFSCDNHRSFASIFAMYTRKGRFCTFLCKELNRNK